MKTPAVHKRFAADTSNKHCRHQQYINTSLQMPAIHEHFTTDISDTLTLQHGHQWDINTSLQTPAMQQPFITDTSDTLTLHSADTAIKVIHPQIQTRGRHPTTPASLQASQNQSTPGLQHTSTYDQPHQTSPASTPPALHPLSTA